MICPSCQKDVTVTEQNYGALYTCDQCQAVYFINFEGQAEYAEVPASFEPSADAMPADPFAGSLEPLIDTVNVVSVDAPLEGGLPDELHALTTDAAESTDSEPPIMPSDLSSEAAETPADWSVSEGVNPFETVQEPTVPAADNSFSQVAREISDFGNAEVHLAGMNYDLQISGLDTQETMRLFKEAIEDSKFGWDAGDLMKTVRNGEIRFQRLSPVKAYILAKRLQFLDIEKKWKQNVLS